MTPPIRARYRIETAHGLEAAAAILAGEQSAGTFVKVPGETPELLAAHAALIEEIVDLGRVDSPALPCYQQAKGSLAAAEIRQAEITVAFPFANVGASLPTLLTTLSGNLWELAQFSGLTLLDVEIPSIFGEVYPGPQFGIPGTRRLAGVEGRPLLGTIIKPSVGLSPEATAALVAELCAAGLDFIKDDELQTDSPHSPFAARAAAVMKVVDAHADRTGKKVMVAFNVTGDLDHMRRAHDVVLALGGTCIMVNLLAVGLLGLIELRRHSQLPIHGHRAGWGLYYRNPALGIAYPAMQKLLRLAGADHLHVNGLRNKFCESDASVLASAQACLKTLFRAGDCAMPVFSSGQTAAQIPDTYHALGSADFMLLAGGGILAHPDGVGAGVRSLRQAWAAAVQGIELADYAAGHAEVRHALEHFGL